jgi:hypothetical protein
MVRKATWVASIIFMALATLIIVLVVYFKVIVAEPVDHYVFSVHNTGLFVQENKALNAKTPDYVSGQTIPESMLRRSRSRIALGS